MFEFTEKAPANLRGKRLPLRDFHGSLYIDYDTRINLDTAEISNLWAWPGMDKRKWPTFDELSRAGIVRECRPFIEVDMCGITDWCSADGIVTHNLDVDGIIEFFAGHGFHITIEAIMHQWCAWLKDYKSAYRDEAHGYHLFTSCGHNTFNLHLSSLHPTAADWQETYIA